MTLVVASFLVVALCAYVLFGGADFGGGILEPTLPTKALRTRLQGVMAPVWEANHVWLIAVVVILFVGFPRFYAVSMTRLYVPMSLSLLAVLVRGTFFTLRKYDPTPDRTAKLYEVLFRVSSAMAPFCFGFVVAGLLSRHPGSLHLAPSASAWTIYVSPWLDPFGVACGLFVTCLFGYLASVFFFGELVDDEEKKIVRKRVVAFLAATVVSGGVVLALGALLSKVPLSAGLHPVQILCQVVALGATFGLIRALRTESRWGARYAAGAQVLSILGGWFLNQYPTLMRFESGALTLDQAAAPFVTQLWLVIGLVVVLSAVVPLLVILYRVFDARRTMGERAP